MWGTVFFLEKSKLLLEWVRCARINLHYSEVFLQARCAVTIYEAAGGSLGWHNSGTVGELHMRPLGDGMINFQLHDLLVCLHTCCFGIVLGCYYYCCFLPPTHFCVLNWVQKLEKTLSFVPFLLLLVKPGYYYPGWVLACAIAIQTDWIICLPYL